MSNVWIVIVNWNGGEDTVACLDSIAGLEQQDISIVIVDNGSTDDSIAQIVAWAESPRNPRFATQLSAVSATGEPVPGSPALVIVPAGRNLGFAAANNLGMRLAQQDASASYIWLLNNDTIVDPACLRVQVAAMMADSHIAILGARLMCRDAPTIVQGLAGGFHYFRARGYHIGEGRYADDLPPQELVEREMKYVIGASMFIRTSLLDQIGLMAEDYFLFFEELDWCRRVAPPFRLAIAPNAIVWHKHGASIGTASTTRVYYLNAGLLRFYRKHLPLLLPVAIVRLVREAVGLLRSGNYAVAKAVGRAALDVLNGTRRSGHYGSTEFNQILPRAKTP